MIITKNGKNYTLISVTNEIMRFESTEERTIDGKIFTNTEVKEVSIPPTIIEAIKNKL